MHPPRATRDVASDTLARIRADLGEDAGRAFTRLAADYLARASAGDGPVSAVPAEAAARFRVDARRRPARSTKSSRISRAGPSPTRTGCAHPMYMGHQVSAPLPAAVWTETVIGALNQSRGRVRRCRRRSRRSRSR